MSETDQLVLKIFLSMFVGFVGLTVYYYRQGDSLFDELHKKHSAYYKKIGEPRYFGDPISNWRAQNYLTFLLLRGVPKGFPNDAKARRLANRSRKLGLALFLIVGVSMVMLLTYAAMSR